MSAEDRGGGGGGGEAGAGHLSPLSLSLPIPLSLERHHPRWPTSSSSPISWRSPGRRRRRATISTRPTWLAGCRQIETAREGGGRRRLDIVVAAAVAAVAAATLVTSALTKVAKLAA